MPAASPQTVKLKSTLRLLIPRLRNAQKKDTALSVGARREMAELLAQSREASARIRVENIIHTDITVELMEILELYTELLLARAGLLDMRDKNIKEGTAQAGDDTGLEEAAASIIYAAPRLPRDVRELGIVRNMLIERFGKEFAVRANENQDNCVPDRVVAKLKVDPPSAKLVQAYLEEIARTYSVDWPPHRESEQVEALGEEVDGEDDGGVGGGTKEAPILADSAAPSTPSRPTKIDIGGLQNATPPTSLEPGGAKSPVSVAPPGARSDNLSPKVKLPGGGEVGKNNSAAKSSAPTGAAKGKGPASGGVVPGKVPTVDDLAKRFSALKR
ncbi:Vacuolar protein sorting-associated protein ist1 [Cladophialophora chaetospira]|uniref:Vacuolar protein sorting-associated protein ist1 n=1 Tax=Cladophialophora chaetospira TaxID=386627 RepID=A0AA38UDQ6_9EURO|nr:Vacuolar protein sorting-associated protein ist1 [Cladophialophora chaetospira]